MSLNIPTIHQDFIIHIQLLFLSYYALEHNTEEHHGNGVERASGALWSDNRVWRSEDGHAPHRHVIQTIGMSHLIIYYSVETEEEEKQLLCAPPQLCRQMSIVAKGELQKWRRIGQ